MGAAKTKEKRRGLAECRKLIRQSTLIMRAPVTAGVTFPIRGGQTGKTPRKQACGLMQMGHLPPLPLPA